MYDAENGKASLNRFREVLNSECNTHSKRVAHMAMRNKVFQTIVDFMELYYTTMGPIQIQTDLGDARSAALKHITKLLDDGLVFSSEWYEPDLWIRLAKHPVIKLLEPVVVAYRGVRRSSSNLAQLCSPVPSNWMTLFFKSTRFVSFVYAAYKTNQHHALFSILPKASLFYLHSRLQNLQPSNASLRPIDKSLNNVVQGEFICKEYIERLLHECETSSVSDVTKVPAVEYYAQAPAPTMVDKALQVDFLQLSKSLAKLEMPVLDNRCPFWKR